ncbi:entericidin A/B family lipoprotein [Salmonella enterica subsp. enterica]|nr:entericidin A/B family lipoprotein [Salmonella enterica subsp. enterica]
MVQLLTGTLLTACSLTARGFGEDIQHLGHAISPRAAS